MTATEFIDRWKTSGGAEMANSQSFLNELCDLLDVPHAEPTVEDETQNTYVFEKAVEFNNGDGTVSKGRVDLYRQGCFILESKQGAEQKAKEQAEALATKTKQKKLRKGTAKRGTADWTRSMSKAFQQAKRYAEAIPDEWPPFLVVVDVGHCIDLYADFSQSGKNYVAFPDPQNFRIKLEELENEQTRETLRQLWLDPHSLDPSRKSAKVTRELADRLAKLARSMEGQHAPETVAQFLMRCLFTMFAEDISLLPLKSFENLLVSLRGTPEKFAPMTEELWKTMDTGGFSGILREKVRQFNGYLFKDCTALPLNDDQMELLIEAAEADWKDVEPAIFGTLLERALDPIERHKLGAHYTPRAYVERLVMPTIIEPLREEWNTAYATAAQLDETGKTKQAIRELREFHQRLCNVKVLDPACGSGNFLYVSLELMKRLEGEVLNAIREFDPKAPIDVTLTVDPHQFLGIEVNPRAAAITDLVLWIGYLQWHFRTRGDVDIPEPIIQSFTKIECRDAVLAYDGTEPVFDDAGEPVTRWDGRTMKEHPVTGELVPDETARVQELKYINPRKADWPEADYIVGNPPFVGTRRMRFVLGDAYVDALESGYPEITMLADFVMWWWIKAARKLDGHNEVPSKRFGLITTNSFNQTFNRKVVEHAFAEGEKKSLVWAVADHPWVDDVDGAAVRVAMTVVRTGDHLGKIYKPIEKQQKDELDVVLIHHGNISPDLRPGVSLTECNALASNSNLAYWGAKFYGNGFILDNEVEAKALDENAFGSIVRRFVSGRDLTNTDRERWAIDCYGLNCSEVRSNFPSIYQHLINHVKPERDHNREAFRRDNWWIFGRPQPGMRRATNGLPRYIVTTETAKHRAFTFIPGNWLAEGTVTAIGTDCAYSIGVLSSRIHVTWALAAGGRLGVGNDPRYNKTRCFDPFPFPDPSDENKKRIRGLGEQLDAHRKRQQELHPKLTMTGMYNVLEKLRADEPLTDKEKTIHEQGLVSVLKQIHDDLDAAVFEAYGWPPDLTDEEILEKLVTLNHERAAEEERGLIRWLRPEFQDPNYTGKASATHTGSSGTRPTQKKLDIKEDETPKPKKAKVKKLAWPKSLPERIAAVRSALQEQTSPSESKMIAGRFSRVKAETVEELLETLVEVGQARVTDDGRYVA